MSDSYRSSMFSQATNLNISGGIFLIEGHLPPAAPHSFEYSPNSYPSQSEHLIARARVVLINPGSGGYEAPPPAEFGWRPSDLWQQASGPQDYVTLEQQSE